MRVRVLGMVLALAAGMPAAAHAGVPPAGTNDVGGFRNVLPGGQGRTVNAVDLAANVTAGTRPRAFTDQLGMYTGLVGAAPTLTAANLGDYFKPAGFGAPPGEVDRTYSPRAGVTIVRDRFNVPHVYGDNRPATMWGAGYVSAEDRLFLMDVLRHTGRGNLTELIGAGEDGATVRMDAAQLKVADYTEAELQRMIDEGERRAGAEGRQVKQDLLDYVAGINAYIAEARRDPTKLPGEYPALNVTLQDWKPTDTVAVASLIGGIFGRGGGNEARVAQALAAVERRFGRAGGRRVFDDFRALDDPEAQVTTPRRFPFDDPGRPNPRAIARIDAGSVQDYNPVVSDSAGRGADAGGAGPNGDARAPGGGAAAARGATGWIRTLRARGGLGLGGPASNALLVGARRSASGRSLAVMGPQVGYYSPQILMELDLHGPGIDARGAAFPGISLYVLLGRGRDFAWSATTATTDNVDEFAEELCEPNGSRPTRASLHYRYKGRCVPFTVREVTLNAPGPSAGNTGGVTRTYRLRLLRSVHGPIQATATVRGKPVAIAEARSTYFHEIDSALAFKRLNSNEVTGPASFRRAMSSVNFLFNWFYVDRDDIAYFQSGWFPRRAKGTDPSLPAWGTGQWDWQGFRPASFDSKRIATKRLPQDTNPAQGYFVNWNNKQAPGWRAADDNLAYGPVHRSLRLQDRLRARVGRNGKIDLVGLVKVMEDAATVDLRGQEVYPLLRTMIGTPPAGELADAVRLLDGWAARGAHRRDLDGDNVLDDSAAVILMDAWWPKLVRGAFLPVLGGRALEALRSLQAFDDPANPGGSAYFAGWWGYLHKDLRSLLGRRVRAPYSRRYCGRGIRARCRATLLSTLGQALAEVRAKHGADRAGWRRPATCAEGRSPEDCDQIEFTTAGAVGTPPIPWQDRPTFQQVVEPQG